jgi:hypothetical protein
MDSLDSTIKSSMRDTILTIKNLRWF